MKINLAFKLIGLLLAVFLVDAHSQDLSAVVQAAMQNNKSLKSARAGLKSAQLEARAAKRASLPQIDLDASYNHVTDVPEIQLPFSTSKIRLGTYDKYDSGISLSYPVFTGFAVSAKNEMQEQQTGMQKVHIEALQNQTAFEVISAYRMVQSLKINIRTLTAARQRMQLQLERSRIVVENGMMLAVDTLALRIAVLDYDKRILEAEGKLSTAWQQLENLAGQPVEVTREVPGVPSNKVPQWKNLSQTPIRILEVQKEMAKSSERLVRANYYPKIVLQAAYRYGKPGLDMITNDWMSYGVWGVGISWNLFHGLSESLQIEASKSRQESIEFQKRGTEEKLQLDYNRTLNEYKVLQKQMAIGENAVRLAGDRLEQIKIQFEQGQATVTDFNSANLELTEAQLALTTLRIQLSLKLNELEWKSGLPFNDWSLKQ